MRTLPTLLAGVGLALLLQGGASATAEPFTLLIYESETQLAARTDPSQAEGYWGAYAAYGKAMQDAGILRGGAALQTGDQASMVRAGDGTVEVLAAPAAPVQLGGYFIIDVPDRDTALGWAGKAPAVAGGAVAVRPAYPAPTMP